MFWSKIFVEFQDSRSDDAEATQEVIVLVMVEQIERNQYSNAFDYFHALIEELKSECRISTQPFEACMVEQAEDVIKEQAKTTTEQAKAIMVGDSCHSRLS